MHCGRRTLALCGTALALPVFACEEHTRVGDSCANGLCQCSTGVDGVNPALAEPVAHRRNRIEPASVPPYAMFNPDRILLTAGPTEFAFLAMGWGQLL